MNIYHVAAACIAEAVGQPGKGRRVAHGGLSVLTVKSGFKRASAVADTHATLCMLLLELHAPEPKPLQHRPPPQSRLHHAAREPLVEPPHVSSRALLQSQVPCDTGPAHLLATHEFAEVARQANF